MRFVVPVIIGVVVLLFPLLALAQSSASHTITLRIIAAPPPVPVLEAPEGAGPGYWLHTLTENGWVSEWVEVDLEIEPDLEQPAASPET